MKHLLTLLFLCLFVFAGAQNTQPNKEQIRSQMQQIRQNTNWDDAEEAKKANEEIKKLAQQLNGGQAAFSFSSQPQQQTKNNTAVTYEVETAVTSEFIVSIAHRFFERSYNALDAISKSQFDEDYKKAEDETFSLKSIRQLTTTGALMITFGDDHNLACVYLASAVKAIPTDTLSVNNFGGYLRIIDSTKISLPVLLHANKLFGRSPVILTQIGCSYFELNDLTQAEFYLKEALKYNPDFGQAHTALCDLYIKQNRLEDAILELFAGVKGLGASYSKATSNFAEIQAQSEAGGESKEDFWNEAKNQLDPSEALAPLVPGEEQVKMPEFPDCPSIEVWQQRGGYSSAVMFYKEFHDYMISFVYQFQDVHKQLPSLSENAVLRDYPDSRFALDCITEMFRKETNDKEDEYEKILDQLIEKVNREKEIYIENLQFYTDEMLSCSDGCGENAECQQECFRRFCSKECPNANKFNDFLKNEYDNWIKMFQEYVKNQAATLEDLYAFTNPWLEKIESPYWYRIYSYEVKNVALSIVGNAFMYYPQAFQSLSSNGCGEDCSVWALTSPMFAEEIDINKKNPKDKNCPEDSKFSLGLIICSIDLDCESIEFGCAAVGAASLKRNFKNKSTTCFIGAGVDKSIGFIGGEAKAGFTVTRYDSGDLDVGVKAEVSVTAGNPTLATGKNYEYTVTVSEGYRSEAKNLYKLGL
jgi:tetratricopeptide (TPR) repeat protein